MSQFTQKPTNLHNQNPQKQIKLSSIEHFKQNSLKGSVVRSVCHSASTIEQLISYFKLYKGNEEYISMKKVHSSVNLKLKRYKESVYYGEFVNGKRHGEGVMVYGQNLALMGKEVEEGQLLENNEDMLKYRTYEGQWENDFKHGKGIEKFSNGTVYEGNYVNGKPEGIGRYSWPNGQFYEGEWLNGMKHGSGMWKGAKGDAYVGEWKFGKADGYGVHTWINGDRYQGEFKQCLKHGQGLQRFANGDIYKGLYSHGKPHGFGQYYWVNGSYFKGTFRNGLRCGQGIWKKGPGNSDKYEGQYLNDKKSGYGIFTWASGNVYKGQYENDSRNGRGEMYWTDGSFYRGEWQNGIQHGRGEIYIPGEGVKRGVFQNNTLVEVVEFEEQQKGQERNGWEQQQNRVYQKQQLPQQNQPKPSSSHHNNPTPHSKTRQTFRSRAYSTNTNKKSQTRPTSDNQARVFKLVNLKSINSRKLGMSTVGQQGFNPQQHQYNSVQRDSSPSRFIRFGTIAPQPRRTLKPTQPKQKQRIMHSAFYMHKIHNQHHSAGGKRTAQLQRSVGK